ncbi:apolipoprotein C-II [Rhinophrynus dorsalis]
MKPTQVIAVSLLLVLLSTGIECYRIQKRETPTYLSQVQDFFASSWEQVYSKSTELIEKVRSAGVEEKIKNMYDKGTSAVGIYSNILTDQFYHWIHG